MPYDLFISYSRIDNSKKRVSQLKKKIEEDYYKFSGEKLKCFFDTEEIKSMDDWRHRILQGLKDSHLFLLILSPNYLSSPYCEWEITEYLKYEYSRAVEGGIAQIYFLEIPGIEEPDFTDKSSDWFKKISHRQKLDLRPWYEEGVQALKRRDVKRKLKELNEQLFENLSRLHSAEKSPGNLPAPNKRFVGRENEMKKLHEETGLGKFGVITAVHGMGGLGKTSIAIQYAYAYSHFYLGGRWQIGCEGKTSLAGALRELDTALDIYLTDEEKKDDKLAAQRILRELEKKAVQGAKLLNRRKSTKKKVSPATLLILDNVDKAQLIQSPETDIITGKKWLKLLVTTRMGEEDLGYDRERQSLITIDELPKEDALKLIESYQQGGVFPNERERAAAEEIVKLLDGFTLAVEMTAIYLRDTNYRVTCQDFLKLLKSKGGLAGAEHAAKQSKTSISHEKLVSLTLAPTLEKLSEEEKLVLAYASQLPPDNIPIPWLKDLVKEKYPKLGKKTKPGMDDPWLSLVNRLISLRIFQVVDVDENVPRIVKMHRLVRDILKKNAKIYKSLMYFLKERGKLLEKNWYIKENRWEIDSLIKFSVSKKSVNRSYYQDLIQLFLSVLDLTNELKLHSFTIAVLKEYKIYVTYVSFHKNLHLAEYYNVFGIVYRELGDYKKARTYFQKSLSKLDKNNRQFKREIGVKSCNLAICEIHFNKLFIAEKLIMKSISIFKKYCSQDSYILAQTYDLLGILFRRKGNLSIAKKYSKLALNISVKNCNKNDPILAIRYSNLALIEFTMENLLVARELLTKAINIDKKCYPQDSYIFVVHYANLASFYINEKKYLKAKNLILQSLHIATKIKLNITIYSVLLSKLAVIDLKLGYFLNARKNILKSIRLEKQFFGATHQNFIKRYRILCNIEERLGNHEKVDLINKKILVINKKLKLR